jgi:carbon-monoxide dehydrogenase medium subunit
VIPAPFGYVRPSSLEEALEALAEPDSKAVAGGQSLLPLMKLRLVRPPLLVDIASLDLRGIEVADGLLRVGGLSSWNEIAQAGALEGDALAAIGECAAGIGDLQVRNRGTLGGALAHADPASDAAAVALALGATLHLRSPAGERRVAAEGFFVGPFTTVLAEQELITAVAWPAPEPGSGSAYVAVDHPASGFAVAGAAALVRPDGTTRVALTGVAATPFVLEPNHRLDEVDVLGDHYAPAEYRRAIARAVVQRALERATDRAEAAAR